MSDTAGTGDSPDIGAVWARVQAGLVEGWTIDSLRCASAGLAPHQRSDDWIAIASGPDGRTREIRAADPTDALEGLLTPGAVGTVDSA